MKFVIQRSLFAQMLKRLCGAIQKSTAPTDYGRYLVIKVSKNRISTTVVRDDCIVNSTLDANLVDDKEFLKITEDGICAVNGDSFLRAILDTDIDGPVFVQSEDSIEGFAELESDSEVESEQAEEAEEAGLPVLGSLYVKMTGLRDSTEKIWFQYVNFPMPPAVEVMKGSEITVSGREFKEYSQRVGPCAGGSNQSIDHSHILVRAEDGNFDLVTYDGARLAWAQFKIGSNGKISGLAPYCLMASNSRWLDSDEGRDLLLYKAKSGPDGIILAQDILFGDNVVGSSICRLYSMTDRFAKFERIIGSLDFRYECKVKTHDLKHLVRRLGIVKITRSSLVFKQRGDSLVFSKNSDIVRGDGFVLPFTDAKGEDLELVISSDFIKDAASQAEKDEVDIKFSGKNSLVLMTLSSNLKMFMQPFGDGA